jgi:hypothetical protein
MPTSWTSSTSGAAPPVPSPRRGTDSDDGESTRRPPGGRRRLRRISNARSRASARCTSRREALGPEVLGSRIVSTRARRPAGPGKTARGEARARILARLNELDDELLAAARSTLSRRT